MATRIRSLRARPQQFVMGMATSIGLHRDFPNPELLSLAEVGHRLGISRTTLWRLINSGELDTVHIGARVLIPHASFKRFLDRVGVVAD